MQESEKTQSMALGGSSVEQNQITLGPLSKNLAEHLLNLAKKVTEQEITPKTVSAACQCAGELYKIMKLNWEMKNR